MTGLSADTSYTVQLDGTAVGQITTDETGSGNLALSNLTNTVAAGSVVTVLDSSGNVVLTGTFAGATVSHGGRHHQ